MSDIVLYHYPFSPFSQKIRSMLGYCNLTWQSVLIPPAPPRPTLTLLAGGYRRTPIAQIGADVFCDTRTITTEIARLSGKPELDIENGNREAIELQQRAELELFFACIAASAGFKLTLKTFKSFSMTQTLRLIMDRVRMGKTMSVPAPGVKKSFQLVTEHLENLEMRLSNPFLFGDQPNASDFGVYHGLWFIQELGEKKFINNYPKTLAWINRMTAFGEGSRIEITPNQAIEIANHSKPRSIDCSHQEHPQIGKQVSIAPTDYAQVATQGKLVASTPSKWILSRCNNEVGEVHVHFPKYGFDLQY